MPKPLDDFDPFAASYDVALQLGLSVTGENKDYFIERRVDWVRGRWEACWERRPNNLAPPLRVLDFGCGTGATAPQLQASFPGAWIVGVDSSPRSIEIARQHFAGPQREFLLSDELSSDPQFHLVYCNGVFHHISPSQRPAVVRWLYDRLLPDGWFCLWENNPWNPGTRWVMKRIPFDRDAQTLSYRRSRSLLQEHGFQIMGIDFCFYFPRSLSALRGIEPYLNRLPLGGQYCVFARKPSECNQERLP